MRQNEVRATEHNNTPSRKARQPGRHKSNQIPRGRDQDATRDQPQGEGKHQSAGEGSQQQPNKRQKKGGPTTHKKGHDDHGQTPIAAQAETPTQRNHSQRGATHERKQNTRPRTTDGRESTAQIKTAPNQPTRQNKKGGPRGDKTPRRHAKGSPPHRSKWEQTAMWRPRKEGTGDKMAK